MKLTSILFTIIACIFFGGLSIQAITLYTTTSGSGDETETSTPTIEASSHPIQTSATRTAVTSPMNVTRKGGRDGPDDSHNGLKEGPDGMFHAWDLDDPALCYGSAPNSQCISPDSVDWFRRHVLMAIISGKEGAFRVEVSQCSWLSHFPPENVFVFSDRVAGAGDDRTPHEWVLGELPEGVWEKDGDIYSKYLPNGYVQQVRSAGQGYSAGWIAAQFRFTQALEHMININKLQKAGRLSESPGKNSAMRARQSDLDYMWFMIIDDDTIINLNNLVTRLKQVSNPSIPWYLSRKGWGGAGHIYNLLALSKMKEALPKCMETYMLKSFRASDAMLLKCAGVAKLATQKEQTMSHCPASNLGAKGMISNSQVSFHGKKDFYPPVLLATWRVHLYYLATYCRDPKAGELAAEWSACAFGSCKQHGCTKEKNALMKSRWKEVSQNGSSKTIPLFLLQ